MSGVRTMSWYMAVVVVTLASVIGWKSAVAARPVQSKFCATLVEPLGYLCAEYRTHSADGYELVMHRIGSRRRGLQDVSHPSHTGSETIPGKVQLPVQRSLESSPDPSEETETVSGHQKCSSFLQEKVMIEGPHRSGRRKHRSHHYKRKAIATASGSVHAVTSSGGSDLPTVTEGPSETGKQSVAVSDSEVAAVSASSESVSHDLNSGRLTSGNVPVLIMHQEFLNGDSWFQFIAAGDRFLPVLLADAGFDVWLGHERATYWSHGHLSLKSNDKRYWDWTWDEHAKYDIPALLELIKNITGLASHFIGVSQSATVGAAAATMPESSKFIRSMTMIGPVMYRACSSIALEAWAFVFGNILDRAYYNEGYQNGAFNFSNEFPITNVTGQGEVGQELAQISGPDCCLGSAVIPFTNGWDGTTSFKNLLHDQQDIRTNLWRHYDYGDKFNNTRAYGVPSPPNYLPESIPRRIPILVLYGGQDMYAPRAGVRYLLCRLGSRARSVFLPDYAHYDLTYSVNRTHDVFLPIVHFLEAHRWE